MRPTAKMLSIRSIVFTLIFSVTWVAGYPSRGQAMLAPAGPSSAGTQVERPADLAVIQKTLESKILREKLHAMGLSDAEIQSRLSRLSDKEVHQLASQIRSLRPAGDGLVIGLLVAVLLVVLIIYLIKRI